MTRVNHELAGLATLASTLEISMHALVATYPELRRDEQPMDSAESRSAARLVDLSSQLLWAIERHRKVLVHQPPPDEQDWPF